MYNVPDMYDLDSFKLFLSVFTAI